MINLVYPHRYKILNTLEIPAIAFLIRGPIVWDASYRDDLVKEPPKMSNVCDYGVQILDRKL